jgi:glycosyltransferase involved in cell wall biosynthesis/thioredoxin-like negative regulator of GroEL
MPIRVISRRPAAPPPLREKTKPPFGLPIPPKDVPQLTAGISLCMIVKNEEHFLEQCLQSVADAVDEINIYDTGSTDRTIEIAERFGARVERGEWRNDFAWARNQSLKMATKRWIFQLDADEELVPESKTALREIAAAPAHLTAVWIRCTNASDKYLGGGSVSHAIVRIFPNTERIRYSGAIHEFPSLDGAGESREAVYSPIRIIHKGYLKEVVDARDKYVRNMAIVEASIAKEPEDPFHWYNYGMTAHLGGDQDRGIEGFTKMWALCREHGMRAFTPNGLATLADIYNEYKHEPEEGLQYSLESLRLAPRYANAHFSAGKAYFMLKRYDEAREMYRAAIDDGAFLELQFVVDDEVPAWKAQCEIGNTYAEEKNDAAALEWFEKGLRNRPKVQALRIPYAGALERLGRLSEAERVFRETAEDFGDEQSSLHYFNYLLRHAKEREALTLIDKSVAGFSPEAAEAALVACALVVQKKGWSDGEDYLLRAQAVAPQSEQVARALEAVRLNRSEVRAKAAAAYEAITQGRFEDVLTIVREALAQSPGHGLLSYYAALACANLQRKEDALEFLAGATDDLAGDAAAFLKATLLREFGRNEEALEAIGLSRARNPANVDGMLLEAALLEAVGRIGDAESALRAAVPLERKRASVELAALLLRAGRLEDAKRVAAEALT